MTKRMFPKQWNQIVEEEIGMASKKVVDQAIEKELQESEIFQIQKANKEEKKMKKKTWACGCEYKGKNANPKLDTICSKCKIANHQAQPRIQAKKQPKEVILKAFTGMVIGRFPVERIENGRIYVNTKAGQSDNSTGKILVFDEETLQQINAKNPRFANKVELA